MAGFSSLAPSGVPSLSILGSHPLAAIVLFFGLFAGLAFLFARDSVGHLAVGFVRTLASLFTSPFVFLHRIVLRVADVGKNGDAEIRRTRLYLINKLLIAVNALLIIVALSGLAVTVLAAWEAFQPPKYLRDAVSAIEERLTAERAEVTPLSARVTQLDEEWKSKRQSLIDNFKNERQKKLDVAVRDNQAIDASAGSDPQLAAPFGSIRTYLANNANASSAREIQGHHDEVVQFIGRLPVSEQVRTQLTRYADNWQIEVSMRRELGSMSEDDLRSQIQPDYVETKQRADALNQRVLVDDQTLTRMRVELQYSPGAALFTLAVGMLWFLFTIWMFGLLIEAVSLAVNVADDIRSIRDLREASEARKVHTATTVALS